MISSRFPRSFPNCQVVRQPFETPTRNAAGSRKPVQVRSTHPQSERKPAGATHSIHTSTAIQQIAIAPCVRKRVTDPSDMAGRSSPRSLGSTRLAADIDLAAARALLSASQINLETVRTALKVMQAEDRQADAAGHGPQQMSRDQRSRNGPAPRPAIERRLREPPECRSRAHRSRGHSGAGRCAGVRRSGPRGRTVTRCCCAPRSFVSLSAPPDRREPTRRRREPNEDPRTDPTPRTCDASPAGSGAHCEPPQAGPLNTLLLFATDFGEPPGLADSEHRVPCIVPGVFPTLTPESLPTPAGVRQT
jgi:hypothetical protein